MNITEYERMFHAEETQWWYVGMRQITAALLSPYLRSGAEKPFRILDVGCGTGNNLTHLSRHGLTVGVDLSPEALRFCQKRGVTVARAELLALPFPSGIFDCVTSFDVLYHLWVSDDQAAVQEMARTLTTKGFLLVRVPALKMLWGAHDTAVYSRHRYTRGEVRQLMTKAGLEVLQVTYCNTLLFPVIALTRFLDRVIGRKGSDVKFLPVPLEWSFRKLLSFEAFLIRYLSLPIGASVLALGRKP